MASQVVNSILTLNQWSDATRMLNHDACPSLLRRLSPPISLFTQIGTAEYW